MLSCWRWLRSEHHSSIVIFFFFFFQAEDGIRDLTVTGVQTCALPISRAPRRSPAHERQAPSTAEAARGRLSPNERMTTRTAESRTYRAYVATPRRGPSAP